MVDAKVYGRVILDAKVVGAFNFLLLTAYGGFFLLNLPCVQATLNFLVRRAAKNVPLKEYSAPLKDFSLIWATRVPISLAAITWVGGALLKLPLLWEENLGESRVASSPGTQRLLCRLQPIICQALGEFFCLLLTVIAGSTIVKHIQTKAEELDAELVRAATEVAYSEVLLEVTGHRKPTLVWWTDIVTQVCGGDTHKGSTSARIIWRALLGAVALAVMMVFSVRVFEGDGDDAGGLHRASKEGGAADCGGQSPGCTICLYPMGAVLAYAPLASCTLVTMTLVFGRLRHMAINESIRRRVMWFQGTIAAVVVGGTGLRVLSRVPSAGSWTFWLLTMADVMLSFNGAGTVAYVFSSRPVMDDVHAVTMVLRRRAENDAEREIDILEAVQ